jgi:hypothetical protein
VTVFLQSLENYVTEVAMSNHGAKPHEVIALFKQNFNRAMIANVGYHLQMADLFKKEDDDARASLHKLQAEIYRTIGAK